MDGYTGLMEGLHFDSLSQGLMIMNGLMSSIYDTDTPKYS